MRNLLLPLVALVVLAVDPAQADRPVTEEERAKLLSAIAAEGCSGGKMEFDDCKYEVDDAKCSDGKMHDLKFDAAFRLTHKKLED